MLLVLFWSSESTADHTAGIYPVSAAGIPFSMAALASKGDIITDLHEDLAADGARLQEQRGGFIGQPCGFAGWDFVVNR